LMVHTEAWPGANDFPYYADRTAQWIVNAKRGMTRDEVSVCLGAEVETVRQRELAALRALCNGLRDEGHTGDEIVSVLLWLVSKDPTFRHTQDESLRQIVATLGDVTA